MLMQNRLPFTHLVAFIFSFFLIFDAKALDFDKKIYDIKKEVNKDNLSKAIKDLGKVEIKSEVEQDKVDLLFGDIYLKINQPSKAENFYQKTFMSSDNEVEALSYIGLAEVNLRFGRLEKAIEYANDSLKISPNNIRPKIILATAKDRIGKDQDSFEILNSLYSNERNNAEVILAIADYHLSKDDYEKSLEILEKFIKISPSNVKIMDQLGNLYLILGNKEKALEYKFKVFKHHEFNKNKYQAKKVKLWIISVEPKFFDKKPKIKTIKQDKSKDYEKDETDNYDKNKIVPHYEEFAFAVNAHGSGFIVGDGKYVITNNHVIKDSTKVAVRNGIGTVSNAKVVSISEKYDLAILELEKPYPKNFAITSKNFEGPVAGDDVISIGYPGIGITFEQPTITQGIISKVFDDEEGIFLTTAAINSGNSGGPIFNLNGKLVGVSFAALDKAGLFEKTGQLPTDMGYAIKSTMIKKVFKHKKGIQTKKTKYSKAAIYEKMLPSVVLVVVSIPESKWISKKPKK